MWFVPILFFRIISHPIRNGNCHSFFRPKHFRRSPIEFSEMISCHHYMAGRIQQRQQLHRRHFHLCIVNMLPVTYTNWCPVTTRTGSARYATNKLDENYGKFGWRARNTQPPRQRFAYSAEIKWNYLIKFSKLEMVGTCISIRRPRIIYTVGSSPGEELKRRWGEGLHGARQNDR